jgi:hypothetical protein
MPEAGDGQFIGPLILAFLPIFLFWRTPHPTLRFLIKVMAFSFGLGLFLSHMLRFSMPAFVLLLIIYSALLAASKQETWKSLWCAAIGVCALLSWGIYLNLSAQFYDGTGLWAGRETRENYLDRKLPNSYEPIVQWTDQNLPSDARLLIVGDARGVYYRRPYFANSVFDDPFFAKAAREETDAAGIARRLRRMGVDEVVVNIPEGLRVSKDYHQYELTSAQWMKLNQFVDSYLKIIFLKNFLAVYQVESKPRGRGFRGPNPFSFFHPEASDYFQAVSQKDSPKAIQSLKDLLAVFPRESYWLAQKKQLEESQKD